ncbi:hypothetical protein CAPTEDRAFT_212972 [Capitella teleta]|uniref:NF-X1-type domain-containing protein n=1 Tax=Capitella teleta TaxID=283909 RepID=R7U8Y9_CAPTE|nr:hypothetical protein CAPTEDRAFT_212972 [Capitella teleta]|eukprot:ELU02825.1 hypothetical protein CAPTEDRAFT_212972 [Capitella teleta]
MSNYQPQRGRGGRNRGNSRDGRSNGQHRGPASARGRWGYRQLEALAQKEPKDILLTVSQIENGFVDVLQQDLSNKPDFVCLILEISSKACSCSDLPTALIQFMSSLKSSTWMRMSLLCYLAQVSFLSVQKAERPLVNAIKLTKTFLEKMPNSVCDYMAIINMIPSGAKSVGLEKLNGQIEELLRMMELARSGFQAANSASAEREAPEPDGQDFRSLSVFPTVGDVDGQKKAFIEKNKTKGGYRDVIQYLDRHFRLLKEDLVAPIRSDIASYREKGEEASDQKVVKAYKEVRILYPVCTNEGVAIRMQFDVKPLKHVRWEQSKRLMYGSLVCLTADDFKTFVFAAVANRDADMLAQGKIDLCCNTLDDNERLQSLAENTFVMMESPTYFEAYRHVLKGLQEMADSQLPFAEQLVHCRFEDTLPKYLTHAGKPIYNLACLQEDSDGDRDIGLHVSLQEDDTWPHSDDLGLNDAQFLGLKHCFLQNLSLIQGPPGTGKTYLGLKVVQSLLENRRVWMNSAGSKINSPLLIVCYTNHALDQFLIGIHKTHRSGKMVRIGGQSKNESLSEFSIRSLRRKYREERRFTSEMYQARVDALRSMQTLRNHIDEGVAQLQACEFGILHELMLKEVMGEDIWYQLISEFPHFKEELSYGKRSAMESFLQFDKAAENVNPRSARRDLADDARADMVDDDVKKMIELRMVDDAEESLIDEEHHQVTWQEVSKRFCTLFGTKFIKENKITPQRFQVHKDANKLLAVFQNVRAMDEEEAENVQDIWKLNMPKRWALYKYWANTYKYNLREQIWEMAQQFERVNELLKERLLEEDFFITSSSYVVGMTTTAAAKCHDLLQKLKPRIVILEEAAEVLEGHVITTLTSECQHLILIGDHQQLKPNPTVHELAVKYNLNVSLFERMINNGANCVVLEEQRRMRPEIAKLIQDIYPNLKNADCVKGYDDIPGIGKNLFLVNHSENESRVNDSVSISNQHESEFVVNLCRYLLLQGCPPDEITILTPYSGQLHALRKLMHGNHFYQGVRACTVDNYQGEENEIIILSLVRSNDDRKLGFLAEDNRVCVALSRAKKGFYCIGDFEMLAGKSQLWHNVVRRAERMGCYGHALPLVCRNHPEEKVFAIRANDFDRAPEGGCMRNCSFRLPCGHVCGRACHAYDMEHTQVRCLQPCALELCERGHRCRKRCCDDCGSCEYKMRIIFDCKHTTFVPCPQYEEATCREPCEFILSCGHPCKKACGEEHTQQCMVKMLRHLPCGHSVRVPCYLTTITCRDQCKAKLPCGHICTGSCGLCQQGKHHIACSAPCTAVLVCGHTCAQTCSDVCPPCEKQCEMQCSHSPCRHACGSPCIPCKEPCAWVCKHHQCSRLCDEPCDRPRCDAECDRTLKCGHPCVGLCGEPCMSACPVCDKDKFRKYKPTDRFIQLECGHFFEVRWMDRWMDSENSLVCPKTCPDCGAFIVRSLRYGAVVKDIHSAIEKVKRKLSSVLWQSFLTDATNIILRDASRGRIGGSFSLSMSRICSKMTSLPALQSIARIESGKILEVDSSSAGNYHRQVPRTNYVVLIKYVLEAARKLSVSASDSSWHRELQGCVDILLDVELESISNHDVDEISEKLNVQFKKLGTEEVHLMSAAEILRTDRPSYRSDCWKRNGGDPVSKTGLVVAPEAAVYLSEGSCSDFDFSD